MKIKKETFIEELIKTSIAQGEAFEDTCIGKTMSESKAIHNLANKLGAKLRKMADFLTNDPVFARETLDKLILENNYYVMFCTAGFLWEFNYRIKDCYRLFEKVIENKEKKHGLTLIAAENFYLAIKEDRLKRRREFPKLD